MRMYRTNLFAYCCVGGKKPGHKPNIGLQCRCWLLQASKRTGAAIFNNEPADIQISARAVFSKYSITPARALNFGPAMYNTSAGPRTLEVTNVGEVPVNLRLFDPAKGLVSSASPRTA